MALARTDPVLLFAQATHEGMSGKHNEDNLDSFCWQVDGRRLLHLGVVADGIGGQIAGELASRLAVEAVGDYFDGLAELSGNLTDHLVRAIALGNQAVYQHGQSNPELQGMGTTMVIAGVLDGRLYIASVGDSRIYLLRDGRLRQLTIDHTWAQEAIEAGLITREQAKTHPNRNVIKRFLGGFPEVEVDTRLCLKPNQSQAEMLAAQGLRLRAGDTVILCSDGLSDMINDEAIHDSLYNYFHELDAAAQELVDKANKAGGKDNITIVIMQVPGGKAVLPVSVANSVVTKGIRQPQAAVAPTTTVKATAASDQSSFGVSLLLLGGGLLGMLLLLGLGALVMIGINNGRQNNQVTPSITPISAPAESVTTPTNAAPEGPAATAAILAPSPAPTDSETPEDETESGLGSPTPPLIPTLQPTSTNTPIPPTLTPTATATPVPTATSEPAAPPPPGDDPPSPRPSDTPTIPDP